MRVSVIIPVYNGAATVGDAIESALAQDVAAAEIIVVNDGSTDSTAQVLEKYQSFIKLINQANAGLCAARNAAVAASTGDHIALLDADDLWLPGRLQKTVAALDGHPEATLAFSDYQPMDSSGRFLDRVCAGFAPSHNDLLERAWPIVPSAVTLRRSALDRVGGFCEEFKGCGGGEDQYMWLLLSECGPFDYVPEPLVIHRRTSPMEIVDKYEPGRRTFVRLVRERYGSLGSERIREASNFFSGVLLAGASSELDAGNLRAGLRMLLRALRYRPFFPFHPNLFVRLFSVRNARRLAKSLGQAVRLG